MADAITLFSPVGTVKFDCTREPDRYYDGHTITLFFKDSDEDLRNSRMHCWITSITRWDPMPR